MISIVIPTYNEEENIVRCLRSLADQTVPRSSYEIIVVDGNSTDETRERAEPLADMVLIQRSRKVGGARNDGAMEAGGAIVATTDADCVVPKNWVETIARNFERRPIVQLYGTVYPIEDGLKHRISLASANAFSLLGYCTGIVYFTLGCNTAFDREAFIQAGMYRCIDAGDDLEIARRMRKLGRVHLDPNLRVGFSMRRYQQFGTIRSIYEWLYIVSRGGDSPEVTYSKRDYK